MKEQQQTAVKFIVIAGAVGYLLFLTYRAVAFNYRTNMKISSLGKEISLLESEKDYLESLNVYYATDTYKELEARRKLGLKKADEKVVKIPIDPNRLAQVEEHRETIQKTIEDDSQDQQKTMGNPRKWIKFVLRI